VELSKKTIDDYMELLPKTYPWTEIRKLPHVDKAIRGLIEKVAEDAYAFGKCESMREQEVKAGMNILWRKFN
jgi:hypothetical protein